MLQGLKNMKRRILCISILTVGVLLSAESGFYVYLQPGIDIFEKSISEPMVVSFSNFTYGDKKIGSGFSKYLETQLCLALGKSDRFQLFAKDRLEEILESIELSLSDLIDSAQSPNVGKLKAIQGLISGRFFDTDDTVQVFLELLNVETGTILSNTKIYIPKSEIPASVSIKPQNYSDALYVLDELARVENADNKDFIVKLWTKRGDGGTYIDGEKLVVNFYTNRNCYIKIYHVDVRKNMQLIFPNEFYSDNFINKKRLYKIPDERYPFSFVLGEPYGTEFIKVIASTVQFIDIEKSFENLGITADSMVKRGLKVSREKAQTTELMSSYTILADR